MENGNIEDSKDGELGELSEKALKETGLSGNLVKRLIGGLKGKGAEGKAITDTLVIMTRAAALSTAAQKQYWDIDKDKPKTNADYERATELAERSIKLLDTAMASFPALIATLLPIKKKVMVQLKDIRYQQGSMIKSPEELAAEVDRDIAVADSTTSGVAHD